MNITPSSLPRLRHCLGGSVFAPVYLAQQADAARGTALHGFLQALTNGATREEALAAVPEEWRNDAEAIDLDALPPLTSASAEVALAWAVATDDCRVLGVGLSREEAKAACRPGEMPMVLDRVGATSPTSGVVTDWKSGRGATERAAEHWQLLTYLAVALLAYGWDEVTGYLANPEGRTYWDGPVRLDWMGAVAHLARVRELLGRVETARAAYKRGEVPALRLGGWCDYCPAARTCPAKVGAAVALVAGDAQGAIGNVAELSPEAAGALWWRLKNHVLPFLEETAKSLEGIAKQTPLPLPDGGTLMEVEEGEDKVVSTVAEKWLADNYGVEVAKAAVTHAPKCSWESLDAALKAHALPAKLREWEASGRQGKRPSLAALSREVRRQMLNVQVAKRATWKAVRSVKALTAG